ncbi:MAG: hypothetical protein IKE30_08160 [Clostridia bacterium]|nr:hypothetical protein [Clostridia bacterium]
MKTINKKVIAGLAAVLALVMGFAAFAENTGTEAVPDRAEILEEAADAADTETAEEPAGTEQDDAAALQEALNAYRSAKAGKRLSDLEEELNEMAEADQLTQEQASLILDQAREQQALKNGQCPNCGSQIGSGRNGQGGFFRGGTGGNRSREGRGSRMKGMDLTPQQSAPRG